MFIILKNTLFGYALVIETRGNVGLHITDNLEQARKFKSKTKAMEYMVGNNASDKVIIMSVKEYKLKTANTK